MTGSLEGVREVVRTLVRLVEFGCASVVFAEIIRLEVLFTMGSRRSREFAVPGLFVTCVCIVRNVSSSKLGRPSFRRPL